MSHLCGRVVDVQDTETGVLLVVAVGETFHEVAAPSLPAPRRGDIVRMSLADAASATEIEIVARGSHAFDPDGDALRWRRPGAAVPRLVHLRARQTIARAVRSYLDEQAFLEVQTPLLVPSTCPDLHIGSFSVDDEFLVTSAEYQLKRMVAGGVDRIYSLTQNFRHGEVSERHNPEFTMLEWARAHESLDAIEHDAQAIVTLALAALRPGAETVNVRGRAVRLVGEPWERLTVREGLASKLGIHVDASFSLESLRGAVMASKVVVPASFLDDAHDLVSFLIDELQKHLGWRVPTFLTEWPAFMTSSAQVEPSRPTLVSRSELVIGGMEVADGFPSLLAATEQRGHFEREQHRRQQAGLPTVRVDEPYLRALEQGLPPGAGMAMGFDRLVMLLSEAPSIRDVLTFAWDER